MSEKCGDFTYHIDCEECPILKVAAHGCTYFPCHLTPDYQRFIDAMIRGVFDCGHCVAWERYDKYEGYCHSGDGTTPESDVCIGGWEERKEAGIGGSEG